MRRSPSRTPTARTQGDDQPRVLMIDLPPCPTDPEWDALSGPAFGAVPGGVA